MEKEAAENDALGGRGLAELCLEYRGLGPDSHEALVLDAFRQVCLSGRKDWEEYKFLSERLAVRLGMEEPLILERLFMTLVQPCLFLVERGELERARELYYEDLRRLETEYEI